MVNETKPIFSRYTNVLNINVDGKNLKDPEVIKKIDKQVEAKVKGIIDELKSTHAKFSDIDFGPTSDDYLGANSLYGTTVPAPAGSKYPRPEDLKWERPLYDDNHFDEEADNDKNDSNDAYDDDEFGDDFGGFTGDDNDEIWCKHGNLFIDGTSSGDVIQGQLGDCWFLGGLAVMGANEGLLKDCFWRGDVFKNYGLFVVRFFKDVELIYVLVDDRIPCKQKDGKVIFAACKDPNELWVPLMEKAYAKLHGNYGSLIGGYSHHALSDMTGYCPKLVTLKPGYPGFNENLTKEEVWDLLLQYESWGCLMGTSIQSDPKQSHKIEAEAGMGLHMGHAYSFLGVGTIKDDDAAGGEVQLVRLRNPWGHGEWEGAYGDRTDERERDEIQKELEKYFKKSEHEDVEINFMDGSFFMPFDDWLNRFTSLFVAVNFPLTWTGKRTQGYWSGENGGNREMGSWISNPKIKFSIKSAKGEKKGIWKHVFVGLYTHDSRLVLGKEYYKDPVYSTPLAFDVVTAAEFDKKPSERLKIPFSSKHLPSESNPAAPIHQAPYNYGNTQIECYLQADVDYYIIPFLFNRKQPGAYYVNVYTENDFDLEGGAKVQGENDLMVVGNKTASAVSEAHTDDSGAHWNNPQAVLNDKPVEESKSGDQLRPFASLSSSDCINSGKTLSISKSQFYEKAEQLRDRFVSESKRLGVSVSQMKGLFSADKKRGNKVLDATGGTVVTVTFAPCSYSEFKRRLMDIGFSLTDLPDEDLVVLDGDNSGTIDPDEFLSFFEQGLAFHESENMPTPPPPPVDDLMYKAADLEGVLKVKVNSGRALRQPVAWFSHTSDSDENVTNPASVSAKMKVLNYDPVRQKECFDPIFHQKTEQKEETERSNILNKQQPNNGITHEDDLLSPLKSPHVVGSQKKNGGTSVAGSTTSTIRRLGEGAAQDSGIKLHSDSELREAEVNRAIQLQNFRKVMKGQNNENHSNDMAKIGIMRKREKTRSRMEKRNIHKDMSTLCLLNKDPTLVLSLVDGTDTVPAMRAAYKAEGKKDCPVPLPSKTKGNHVYSKIRHDHATMFAGTRSASKTMIQVGGLVKDDTVESESCMTMTDIWDILIDRVIIISDSRIGTRGHNGTGINLQDALSKLKSKHGNLNKECFTPFMNFTTSSRVVTPHTGVDKVAKKGTTPTPRTLKKFPGWASVTSAQNHGQLVAANNTVKDAADKVREMQKGQFYECYRRLVCVPVLSSSEMDGDRRRHSEDANNSSYLSAFAKRLFAKFDKNLNGVISLQEFTETLTEMNINVSEEDSLTLFNRFETRECDGTIDWNEFLDFFHNHIVSDMVSDWDLDTGDNTVLRPVTALLLEIRPVLLGVVNSMVKNNWGSIDDYITKTAIGRRSSVSSSSTYALPNQTTSNTYQKVPDNCIFHHLNSGAAQRNMSILSQLGLTVSIEEMKRINRAFGRNVGAFMNFITGQYSWKLDSAVNEAHQRIISAFESRVGVSAEGDLGRSINHADITKLWNILSPEKKTLRFDEMVSVIEDVLTRGGKKIPDDAADLIMSPRDKKAIAKAVAAAKTDATLSNEPIKDATTTVETETVIAQTPEHVIKNSSSGTSLKQNDLEESSDEEDDNWNGDTFMGVDVELIARCCTDHITSSAWNKPVTRNNDPKKIIKKITAHNVSYCAFEAYVRYGHIIAIESKLKYLLQLEMSIAGPSVWSLMHVYMNQEQNEIIVLLNEPLSGDVISLSIKDDFTSMPSPNKLSEILQEKCDKHGLSEWGQKGYFHDNEWLYTPSETPAEDKAISDIVDRLRIIRTTSAREPNKLEIAEDPRLVLELNKILDAAIDLPFFCTCSSTSLYFEADSKFLSESGSGLKTLIFGHIRKSKVIHNFLVNIVCNLNVILTSYNAGIKITLSWRELLAHLTDYRNPFVTAELKPQFLEPHQYVYVPHMDVGSYNGEDDDDPLSVQKSRTIIDGGSHPQFDAAFAIKFRPPKLTTCKLLSTEIHKMKIGGESKYVVLMVREAKRTADQGPLSSEFESFRFITIYDPKSATDYQCGVLSGCNLHRVLIGSEENDNDIESQYFNSVSKQTLEVFMKYVVEAADTNMILLGPAITPRLILSVLNEKGRSVEILGQCEMSISSVLSGSGVGKPSWCTITYSKDNNDKDKEILMNAGEIEVELGFRKLDEIQNEIDAEKARLKRRRGNKETNTSKHGYSVNVERMNKGIPPPPVTTPAVSELNNKEIVESNEAKIAEAKEENKKMEKNMTDSLDKLKSLQDEYNAANSAQLELRAKLAEEEATRKALEERCLKAEAEAKALLDSAAAQTLPVTSNSPSGKGANKGSEATIASRAVTGVSSDDLKELEELRALKTKMDKMEKDASNKKASDDKRAKKLEAQLAKQKEAHAAEKAALEQQLAKESAEREKLLKAQNKSSHSKGNGYAPAAGGGIAVAKDVKENSPKVNLSASTPITNKEKSKALSTAASSVKTNGSNKVNGEVMSVSGSAYGTNPLAQTVAVENASSRERLDIDTGNNTGINSNQTTIDRSASPSIEATKSMREAPSSPTTHIDWSVVPLPQGWEVQYDTHKKRYYYLDHNNKKTQWKHPLYVSQKMSHTNL